MSDSTSIPLETSGTSGPRKVFLVLILPALLIAGGWFGFKYARLYLTLFYAHSEFSKQQFLRAEFWTNRAFSFGPRSVEATRLMAEINEAQDRPTALPWRVRAVQLNPENTGDIMAWAKCALRFHQNETVLKALQCLPPDFPKKSAEYQTLMANLALTAHETGLAEYYFSKAAELDSNNPVNRLNLAAFRLTNYSTQQTRDSAARELEKLLDDKRVRIFAARVLLGDAIRYRNAARARIFAEKLHSLPEHTFSDELRCLESVTSVDIFRSSLDEIQHRAELEMPLVVETGEWLLAHRMPTEMLRWHSKLPESMQSHIRVQITAAQAYITLQDWEGLKTFLKMCDWKSGDYLRQAMLIRCQRELAQPWEKDWSRFTSGLESSPNLEILLAQQVLGWPWRTEAINLLRKASSRPETESKALQALWDIYSMSGETIELLHIAKSQLNLEPANPTHKNNVAFLSLLLNGASENSERLAREVSTSNPQAPEWATTYAYALILSGKKTEAKKVMEHLSPETLARPGIALYYAIVLAANDDSIRALAALEKLNPSGMLPQEQKLATDLLQRLKSKSP